MYFFVKFNSEIDKLFENAEKVTTEIEESQIGVPAVGEFYLGRGPLGGL